MSDNRRAPRRRCLIGARVILTERASTINCVVRSLSETGAKIEFEAIQVLPQSFVIRLDTGIEYLVEKLAWHNGKQVGVIFAKSDVLSDTDAFSRNKAANITPFQDMIDPELLILRAGSENDPVVDLNLPPVMVNAYQKSDFGLEYRKRLADQLKKTA